MMRGSDGVEGGSRLGRLQARQAYVIEPSRLS